MNNNEWQPIELLQKIIYENKWNYIILLTKNSFVMIGKIYDLAGIYTIVNEQNRQNLLKEIEHDYDDKVTHFMICPKPPQD